MKRRVMAIVIALTLIIGFLNIQGKKNVVNAIEPDDYTITFDGNGGTLKDPISDEYKTTISGKFSIGGEISAYPYQGENNNKILMGFKIQGGDDKLYVWSGSDFYVSDETTPNIHYYNATGDTVFIAQWKDTHKVTMKYGTEHRSGFGNTEVEYYIGDGMPLGHVWGWPDSSDEYTSEAYKKVGDNNTYYTGKDGYNEMLQVNTVALSNYIVNEDTVFEVVWVKEVTAVFECNGGYIPQSSVNHSGNTITQNVNRTVGIAFAGKKIGYFSNLQLEKIKNDDGSTFKGWKKDGDSHLYSVNEIKNMVFNTNTTFTAQWESVKKDSGSSSSSKSTTPQKSTKKYSNEWVAGKWYNADGSQTYKGTMKWKNNSKGWWIEDSAGWYPKSQWQKIDGKWYYFCSDGYMDYSEYRDGCWLGSDGAWIESYSGGKWSLDSTGWWYSDSSGWYPANQWLWIDGTNYHFNAKGYCTNP